MFFPEIFTIYAKLIRFWHNIIQSEAFVNSLDPDEMAHNEWFYFRVYTV